MLFKEGDLINQYHVKRKIASGGMGDIYLATDTENNRDTVLKILNMQYCSDELVKLRFVQEGQTTTSINHPNVIKIYISHM